MRLLACVSIMFGTGCSLYFDHFDHHIADDVDAQSSCGPQSFCGDDAAALPPYTLTVDHAVAAEGSILGVDADGVGNLWIAYPEPSGSQARVTLVHWDPVSRTRLAAFTFDELLDPVSIPTGLAYVGGQIWMSYPGDGVISSPQLRVIDPTSFAVVRTLGGSAYTRDLSAFSNGRLLIAEWDTNSVIVTDPVTGGNDATIPATYFATTLDGVAWQPGEIWLSSWDSRVVDILSESGTYRGVADLSAIPASTSADDRPILAFDRGMLLVGYRSQLTWFDVYENGILDQR